MRKALGAVCASATMLPAAACAVQAAYSAVRPTPAPSRIVDRPQLLVAQLLGTPPYFLPSPFSLPAGEAMCLCTPQPQRSAA